jgi:Domain of unknown function (DUF4407)
LNKIKSKELNIQRNVMAEIGSEIQSEFKKFQVELDKFIQQKETQKVPLMDALAQTGKDCPLDIAQCRSVAKGNVDLLSRYDALGKAKAASDGNSIWWASFVITLLFIFLELAPVLSKLISNKGSYDERLESLEAIERLITSEQNNEINEKLLDIESENEKNKELRRFSKEEENIKLATKLFKTQEEENLEKLRISDEIAQDKNRQELMAILQGKGISVQLEEAKATLNITIDTILSGEEAEKQLQKKVADYIANKQFEHLKNEVDDFFDNKTKTEFMPSEQYHLS